MIAQFGHVADRTYSYDEESERKAFTLFWEMHDARKPYLTRRLIENWVAMDQSTDKEASLLMNHITAYYETT